MTWDTLLRPPLREIGAYEPGEPLDELMARHGLSDGGQAQLERGPVGPAARRPRRRRRRARPVLGLSRARLQHAARGDRRGDGRAARAGAPRPRHPGADPDARQRVRQPRRHRRRARARPTACTRRRAASRARASSASARPSCGSTSRRSPPPSATTGAKLVWICDPNNPTGLRLERRRVAGVPRRASARTASWSPTRRTWTTSPRLERVRREDDVAAGRRVVVLRTFSKIFGLAGLRLGYLLADPDLVRYLNSVQEPFNVNRAALAAGVASLGRAREVAERRDLAARARERLAARLAVGGMAPGPVVGELRPRRARRRRRRRPRRRRSSAAAC